jgi:hypothetical protein
VICALAYMSNMKDTYFLVSVSLHILHRQDIYSEIQIVQK